MIRKFRSISVICTTAIILSTFAACGGNSSSDTGASTTAKVADSGAETTSAKAEKSGSATNITWYIKGKAPNQPDAVIKALNEKSAEDIGVTVDFKFDSEAESVKAALAAGDANMDIVFSAAWFTDYRSSALNNFYVDLTDLVAEKTPELYSTIPEILWEGTKVGGKIYGVPTWKDSAETQFWIGRTSIIESAGAADDFAKANVRLSSVTVAAEKVKVWHEQDTANNVLTEGATNVVMQDQKGDWSIGIEWDKFNNDLEIGVKNFDEDNPKVMWMYDEEEYVNDLKTLKSWADTGISNGIVAGQIESAPAGVFARGVGWDGAQYTVWGGDAIGYESTLMNAGGPFLKSTAAIGSVNCIPLNSKNVDAALSYLQYINTDKSYRNMLAYGIEGVNFEVVDNKYKTLTGYDWVTPNYTMASFNLLYAPVEVPNADMYEVICDGVFTAPKNVLTGFAPDMSNIQNEIAACSSIVKENAYALHRGDVKDVDAAIKAYKGKLMSLGMQTIIDELQAQVDAFVAAK